MNIRLRQLEVTTRQTIERFDLSAPVTFLYGPIGAGKSSVARLVDYCFGGRLERTPAIQLHFVSARLLVDLGSSRSQFERAATDSEVVRVSWESNDGTSGSVAAPLEAADSPIVGDSVYNLSDLIFWLAGVEPIKVRRSKRDPNSPLVRLSFRELLWYCYLRQDKLDSSFFRLEDTFKRQKSMDVMRFLTGIYSDRMNELEARLAASYDSQRAKRESVLQIREFLRRFSFASELDLAAQIEDVRRELAVALQEREVLDRQQSSATHPADPLRDELRRLNAEIAERRTALEDLRQRIRDQESLRSELITSKVKATRAEAASTVLAGVSYARCPCCGVTVDRKRFPDPAGCYLCGAAQNSQNRTSGETEALHRDLNARIDDLSDSVSRHKRELNRGEKALEERVSHKAAKDAELARELSRYDSAFVSSVRAAERRVASLQERIDSLRRLAMLPQAIEELEREAGELQGTIDTLRSALLEERRRLTEADENIQALEDEFLGALRAIGYPGVDPDDTVTIDPRNWDPKITHGPDGQVVWGFFDAGSGGKKTLFNVVYALALHNVAHSRGLPLPSFLIVDSPTKNFGRDINRPLALAMFQYAYSLAAPEAAMLQLIIIDSDFVPPDDDSVHVVNRLMRPGDPENPPLISYYVGP